MANQDRVMHPGNPPKGGGIKHTGAQTKTEGPKSTQFNPHNKGKGKK